jgi:hypothetical protein
MTYHPLQAPESAAWLGLTPADRLNAVAACQRAAGVTTDLPDDHTRLHVAMEDLLARGPETAAGREMARLMASGLDRHEAIHTLSATFAPQP